MRFHKIGWTGFLPSTCLTSTVTWCSPLLELSSSSILRVWSYKGKTYNGHRNYFIQYKFGELEDYTLQFPLISPTDISETKHLHVHENQSSASNIKRNYAFLTLMFIIYCDFKTKKKTLLTFILVDTFLQTANCTCIAGTLMIGLCRGLHYSGRPTAITSLRYPIHDKTYIFEIYLALAQTIDF